jgi:hypothetical protein
VVWLQKHYDGFPGLGLKIGRYSLVIWASKSLRWFPGLGLQIKRATVCRLHHKTNGRIKTSRGTCRDLAACFAWKQVGLEFSSLATRLDEAWCGWCMWHHRGDCIELKQKMDRSMRRATSNPSTPTRPLGHFSILVFFLGLYIGP